MLLLHLLIVLVAGLMQFDGPHASNLAATVYAISTRAAQDSVVSNGDAFASRYITY